MSYEPIIIALITVDIVLRLYELSRPSKVSISLPTQLQQIPIDRGPAVSVQPPAQVDAHITVLNSATKS